MKNKFIFASFALVMLFSVSSYAQFNPYANGVHMLTAGIGFSGWGVPIFARYEAPVADNITVGGSLSFQTKSENYASYKWKHTIFGIGARGSYHFNEVLEVNDEWDFYAGVGLGYYAWNTKYDGNGTSVSYGGSGNGGVSLGVHLGGRYFVKDNLAINLEVGGGNVLSGGTIGVTFLL